MQPFRVDKPGHKSGQKIIVGVSSIQCPVIVSFMVMGKHETQVATLSGKTSIA